MADKIDVDCEHLMSIANTLRTGAEGTFGQIPQMIRNAQFTGDAFGKICSDAIKPGGAYDIARQSYEFAGQLVRSYLDSTAKGLAQTAQTYAMAEGLNTLTPLAAARGNPLGFNLNPNAVESDSSRFSAIGDNPHAVLVIAIAPMMEIWLACLGWLNACIGLELLLMEGMVMFVLIQPDDGEIQLVNSMWQQISMMVHSSWSGAVRTLNQVESAWPSAPHAYWEWVQKMNAYVENLDRHIAQVPQYIAAAADQVNAANTQLLVTFEAAFGALAAATALDVLFDLGEAVKLGISIGVIIAIQISLGVILAEVRNVFHSMPEMPQLGLPQPGSYNQNANATDWVQLPQVGAQLNDLEVSAGSSSVASISDING
jgi:hypothetical protein